jgi:serine/threonine protein kinase
MVKTVGKYQIGKTLGEGTFGKVKFAMNTETGESVAIKVLDKERIQKQSMGAQVKLTLHHTDEIRTYNIGWHVPLSISLFFLPPTFFAIVIRSATRNGVLIIISFSFIKTDTDQARNFNHEARSPQINRQAYGGNMRFKTTKNHIVSAQ